MPGPKEMKPETRDLSKIDSKFDRTDSSIDRVMYSIIAGLDFVVGGGFDYYQDHKEWMTVLVPTSSRDRTLLWHG